MRKFPLIMTILALIGLTQSAWAIDYDLTIQNQTVNAGEVVALNVTWTSGIPLLKYLTTEFIITSVDNAPVSELTFTNNPSSPTEGKPAFPPFNDPNYVFFGDSDDYMTLPADNPAFVTTTTSSYDTYNFADSSHSGSDVPQNGTKLWTILNISTTALAAGKYQISLGSSSFDYDTTMTQIPTFTGGLITVVPEPSTLAMSILSLSTLAVLVRRRNRISILLLHSVAICIFQM